jgi:hypothetical protein
VFERLWNTERRELGATFGQGRDDGAQLSEFRIGQCVGRLRAITVDRPQRNGVAGELGDGRRQCRESSTDAACPT